MLTQRDHVSVVGRNGTADVILRHIKVSWTSERSQLKAHIGTRSGRIASRHLRSSVKDPSSGGNWPVSILFLTERFRKLAKLAKDAGSEPVRALPVNCKRPSQHKSFVRKQQGLSSTSTYFSLLTQFGKLSDGWWDRSSNTVAIQVHLFQAIGQQLQLAWQGSRQVLIGKLYNTNSTGGITLYSPPGAFFRPFYNPRN